MTFREKITKEHPEKIDNTCDGGVFGCPYDYYYEGWIDCSDTSDRNNEKCTKCWNREIPEEKSEPKKWICEGCKYLKHFTTDKDFSGLPFCEFHGDYCEDTHSCDAYSKKQDTPMALLGHNDTEMVTPVIKDSGNRREFETGAVRDIHEGKGRCDLLPLDTVARFRGQILADISQFQDTGDIKYLENAVQRFTDKHYNKDMSTMLLEVSKHFEEGCKKYGENNWRKGIPTRCYIDSAVRHYLKYLRGDKDEPHDRAFCWNILCCIWTCIHKPELNDYAKKEDKS